MTTLLQPTRIVFDPKNADHRKAFVNFLANSKWDVKFELEFPFSNLPAMIMYKLSMLACVAEGAVDKTSELAKTAHLPLLTKAENDAIISKKVA